MKLSPLNRAVRAVTLTTVIASALVSVAACSGGGTASPSSSAGGGSATGAPVNLTWWSWAPGADTINNDYLVNFSKAYPNIHVTFKQYAINDYDAALRTAIQGNTLPDLYSVAPTAQHGAQQFGTPALDMAPLMEQALGADWKDKVAPSSIASTLFLDDKLVGIPTGANYEGNLWINKAIFDKYNLQPPTTYDEWKQVCATLKANDVGCFFQGAGQPSFNVSTIHSIAESVAPGLFVKTEEGQAKWTDPNMVKTFQIWKQMFDDGIVQDGALGAQQYPDAFSAFMSGKYAMVQMGTWFAKGAPHDLMIEEMKGAGVGDPQPFPEIPIKFPDMTGAGNNASYHLFGDLQYAVAVNKDSPNVEAAKTFALWLGTSQEGQQDIANSLDEMPSVKGVGTDWNSIALTDPSAQSAPIKEYFDAAANATEPGGSIVSADLEAAIELATTTVAGGNATPEKAMQTLQSTADSLG